MNVYYKGKRLFYFKATLIYVQNYSSLLGCLGSRTLFISSVVQYNVILKLNFALSIYITICFAFLM